MQIQSIHVERANFEAQCGTLIFETSARCGAILWIASWRSRRVSVEFIPAEGAMREDVHRHRPELVDAVVRSVIAITGREALFS